MRLVLILLALASVRVTFGAETDDALLQSGPKTLIITCNVAPANRPELRRIIETQAAPQFRKWQEQGVLESYHLFFNRNTETDTWDLITVVSFADYGDIRRWNEIERSQPGGLPLEAVKLMTAMHTTSLDLTRSGSVPKKTKGKSV